VANSLPVTRPVLAVSPVRVLAVQFGLESWRRKVRRRSTCTYNEKNNNEYKGNKKIEGGYLQNFPLIMFELLSFVLFLDRFLDFMLT